MFLALALQARIFLALPIAHVLPLTTRTTWRGSHHNET